MNNDSNDVKVEALAQAWTVETTDLTARVAAAIGASPESPILAELRALRGELIDLKRSNELLHNELARLRFDLMNRPGPRSSSRLTPYAPSESLVRLS